MLDKRHNPKELNTDKGIEFMSREFQAMLARSVIQHELKVGLNVLATTDRVMGVIKDMLAKRMSELGGDWLTHLEPVVVAYNKLDNRSLHDNAPTDVLTDDDLRFQLRVENANTAYENVQNAADRKDKLEENGAFRTLKEPLAFKRRAGIPNWSSEVHRIDAIHWGESAGRGGQNLSNETSTSRECHKYQSNTGVCRRLGAQG